MHLRFSVDSLRRTSLKTHEALRKLSARGLSSTGEGCINPTLDLTSFSLPTSLAPQLVTAGLDESSALRISSVALQAASRFRDSFIADFECRRQSIRANAQAYHHEELSPSFSSLTAAYSAIFKKAIQKWQSYLISNVTPRILHLRTTYQAQIQDRSRRQASGSRRPFNQTAVPLLERYFDINAFPSRLEKLELAAKCEMEYRQIHVWFQNRRSRLRKDGKDLPKSKQPDVFVELENTVADALLSDVDGHARESDEYTEDSNVSADMPSDFHMSVPAHAFPSPYPPLCSYDPFPMAREKRDFALPWLRRPGVCPTSKHHTSDVTQLITQFSKMNISSAERDCITDDVNCRLTRHHVGFLTPCAPAPHPALLNKRVPPTGRIAHEARMVSLERSFVPTSAPLRSVTSSPYDCAEKPSPTANTSTHVRPKRTLPRRVPKTSPLRSATAAHAQLQRAPIRRAPSASSVSTSTTYDSDTDSAPSTPPAATLVLPPHYPLLSPGPDGYLFPYSHRLLSERSVFPFSYLKNDLLTTPDAIFSDLPRSS